MGARYVKQFIVIAAGCDVGKLIHNGVDIQRISREQIYSYIKINVEPTKNPAFYVYIVVLAECITVIRHTIS